MLPNKSIRLQIIVQKRAMKVIQATLHPNLAPPAVKTLLVLVAPAPVPLKVPVIVVVGASAVLPPVVTVIPPTGDVHAPVHPGEITASELGQLP